MIGSREGPDPFRKLREFADFKDGWAFGEGVAFTDRVLVTARQVVGAFDYDSKSIDVFPGRDGAITVAIY
jgi:hypothetical protein